MPTASQDGHASESYYTHKAQPGEQIADYGIDCADAAHRHVSDHDLLAGGEEVGCSQDVAFVIDHHRQPMAGLPHEHKAILDCSKYRIRVCTGSTACQSLEGASSRSTPACPAWRMVLGKSRSKQITFTNRPYGLSTQYFAIAVNDLPCSSNGTR